MSAIDNGKRLAFPLCVEGCPPDLGLSKREWFAGLAMQGLLAKGGDWSSPYSTPRVSQAMGVAEAALRNADALLAELAKEPAP